MPFGQSATLALIKAVVWSVNAKATFNRHSLFSFHFFLYSDSKCEADVCQRRIHCRMYSHIRSAYFYNQPVVVPFTSISLFRIGISFYVIGFSDAILCYFLMQWDDIRNGASAPHHSDVERGM